MPRIFVIGFPKSGTTSLHEAFEAAGLTSAHWKVPAGYVGRLIYEADQAGDNPLVKLMEYDAITQADICLPGDKVDGVAMNHWPQLDLALLDRIEAANPGMRFILNRRDPDKLVSSMDRWWSYRRRIALASIPGLPRFRGYFPRELRRWITNHYAACEQHFGGRANYLDLDIEATDVPQRLSTFLDMEFPWWGVANANDRVPQTGA